ncbi:hypothetical protein HDV05_003688 [Chytridiales sp. JEL 0842]|nr:hypothetical protein HDV05_003688 [Chytridiales sp. JEL 0842]
MFTMMIITSTLLVLILTSFTSLTTALPQSNPNLCIPQKGEHYRSTTSLASTQWTVLECDWFKTLTLTSGVSKYDGFSNFAGASYCSTTRFNWAGVKAIDDLGQTYVLQQTGIDTLDVNYATATFNETHVNTFLAIGQGNTPNIKLQVAQTCYYFNEEPYAYCDLKTYRAKCFM